jgi:hypothetical protein
VVKPRFFGLYEVLKLPYKPRNTRLSGFTHKIKAMKNTSRSTFFE